MKVKLPFSYKSKIANCGFMLLLLVPPTSLFSQQLDPDFGSDGIVTTSFSNGDSAIEAIFVQNDGKIVAAGDVDLDENDNTIIGLARYFPNGSLDTAFGTQGKTVLNVGGLYSYSYDVAVGSNGQIYVVGENEDSENHYLAVLTRFNSNGTLDTDFGTNGIIRTTFKQGESSAATSVLVQADGKILIAGASIIYAEDGYADDLKVGLARFNSNGSPDNNFGTGGFVSLDSDDAAILAMKLQPDGKIIGAGFNEVSDDTGAEDISLFRFNSNGSLDTSFGNNGITVTSIGVNENVGDIAIQNDGKILITGGIENETGSGKIFATRYTSDGILDNSFGNAGSATLNFGNGDDYEYSSAVLMQNDGKIVISGESDGKIFLARLLSNGSLDSSFGTNGKLITDIDAYLYDGEFTNDGKLLLAGESGYDSISGENFLLAQFDIDAPLGIEDALSSTFSIYPNPTSSSINLVYSQAFQKMDVVVYDVLGNKVLSKRFLPGEKGIDLSAFHSGIYLLDLQIDDNHITRKIVKN